MSLAVNIEAMHSGGLLLSVRWSNREELRVTVRIHPVSRARYLHARVFFLNDQSDDFDIRVHGEDIVIELMQRGEGCLLLGAHMGSFEAIRMLGHRQRDLRVSLVMYEENARKINSVLNAINPLLSMEVIGLGRPDSMLRVRERLDQGHFVGMLADRDKLNGVDAARRFVDLGFELVATAGTADALEAAGVTVAKRVDKLGDEGANETAVDLIERGDITMVVNSPRGRGPRADGGYIRAAAGVAGIPCLTTAAAALAAADGMADWQSHDLHVKSLQEFHQR